MKQILFVATAACLALGACNSEKAENQAEPSKYITVDASMASATRATATAFENGDKISIYAWTGSATTVQTPLVVNNAVNTYNTTDSKWTPAVMMLWKDMVSTHYFLGVYPNRAITNFSADPFTLGTDQTANDLLVATELTGRVATTSGIVPLTFNHIMSKLNVNLKFRDEFGTTTPTVQSVTIPCMGGATIDYLATAKATARKIATTDNDIVTIPALATPVTGYKLSYSGIMVPQTITKVVVTIGTKTYTYTDAGIQLKQGESKTVNLIVGRDQIVLGSVTINDWTTGATLPDGEALGD